MAQTILAGDTSGTVTLQAPAVAGSTVITLPATSGTALVNSNATNVLAEAQGGTGTTTGYYGFKNRIINGAMMIDQRNAGASVSVSVSGLFSVDRFKLSASGGGVFTAQQSSTAPAGFTNSLALTVTTADASITSGDAYWVLQAVEGYNVSDFGFGAAGASTVTVSFWVRSSVTGTYTAALNNGAYDRSYLFNYTINSVNTWEQKTVTVTGDIAGTWLKTNGTGLYVVFDLGSGSTYTSSTVNAWQAGGYQHSTGSTQWIATNGATFYITGVQLEKGSTATSFDYRPYGTELQLCQRYYQMVVGTSGAGPSSTGCDFAIQFPQQMRAAPTCSQAGVVTITDVASADFTQSSVSFTSVDGPSVYGHHIRLGNFTGLTTFRPYLWRNTNTTNNILLYSAEL